jgi:hypothetical protein
MLILLTGALIAPWIYLSLFAIFIVGCVIAESTEWEPGSIVGVIYIGIVLYFITSPFGLVYTHIFDNPLNVFVGFCAYFGIGVVYSVIRWWRYCASSINEFTEKAKNFTEGNFDYKHALNILINLELKVGNHKNLISFWIGYWPVSFLWMLLNDPITKIVRWLFNCVRSTYEAITNYMTADLKEKLNRLESSKD